MSDWLYRFVNFIARVIFFPFTRRTIRGSENMPKSGGVILVANHQHFHDVFNLAAAFKRRIVFMAKKELYKHKFFGRLFRAYGSFPIDRGASDVAAIREALSHLNNEEVIVVFPEGTRISGSEIGDFKGGTALLAAKSGAQVLPVAIIGDGKPFTHLKVNVGEPFSLPKTRRIDSQYLRESTHMIKERVLNLGLRASVGK